jgi:four helix bundle protein
MAGRIQALSERKYLGVNIVNAVNVVTAVNAARSQPRKGVNMKSHKDLDVWRLAVDLATDVYEVTRTFPKEEQYGMSIQMRRSAISIASNIAEGAARHGDKEFLQFIHIALGSASELDTQLEIAMRVNLTGLESLQRLQATAIRINQMLRGLARSVRSG